jgi:hypothetical protein
MARPGRAIVSILPHLLLDRGGRRIFCGAPPGRSFLGLSQSPAARFAMQATILLFDRHRRRSFHAENLVHWFPGHNIIVREPAFSIKRAAIFMFTPVRVF